MNIALKDGTVLNCLAVTSSVDCVKGVNRNCLAFSFNADEVSGDTLLGLFRNTANTDSITVSHAEAKTYEYVDYTIFNGIFITENIINVNMCQLSYLEKQEQERIEQLNALSEVVADILGGALL